MKKGLCLTGFLVVACFSRALALTSSYKVSPAGAYILIEEKRDYAPSRSFLLRKASVSSVIVDGTRITLRMVESETQGEGGDKDKEKFSRRGNVTHVFEVVDEITAKRIFNDISVEVGSQ